MASELLSSLQAHLQALQADPMATPIDKRLLDEAELVLPDTLSLQDLNNVVVNISATLQTIREDAAPLTSLLQRLLAPFTFADVLAFQPPIDFGSGMIVAEHMVSINKLMLYLLGKARTTADVATIASRPDLVKAFVHLWLSTSDPGIAEQAGTLIIEFLKIDHAEMTSSDEMLPEPGSGQGLMWKRLFTDRDVYATIYNDCDLKTGELGRTRVTLAQARLLEALPNIAHLDWAAVSSSHHAEVEAAHGATGGLLEFAALKMVDYEEDVLTYWVLVNFFSRLLRETTHLAAGKQSSVGLEYLHSAGIHQRIAGIYLNDTGGIESIYLYGPAANYLGTYASLYSLHYLSSPLPKLIQNRLMTALDHSTSRWSNTSTAEHDLQLLVQLPRRSLLPADNDPWSTSPISLLPSSASNPAVLNALAAMFHGPEQAVLSWPVSSTTPNDIDAKEASAARALYLNYLANNQKLWRDVVRHADTVALVDTALAAIGLLTGVITANWSTEIDLSLPTTIIPTPETGPLAILSPPALEYALPFLMSPPKTFSNLVGGRGDTESAVYKIAMAKYDALKIFHDRMAAYINSTPDSGFEDVVSTLAKRLAEGPFSRAGEAGGRVATVEL